MVQVRSITSVSEFTAAVMDLGPAIYRGQKGQQRPLLPRLARGDDPGHGMGRVRARYPEFERLLLSEFRLCAAVHVSELQHTNHHRRRL